SAQFLRVGACKGLPPAGGGRKPGTRPAKNQTTAARDLSCLPVRNAALGGQLISCVIPARGQSVSNVELLHHPELFSSRPVALVGEARVFSARCYLPAVSEAFTVNFCRNASCPRRPKLIASASDLTAYWSAWKPIEFSETRKSM